MFACSFDSQREVYLAYREKRSENIFKYTFPEIENYSN